MIYILFKRCSRDVLENSRFIRYVAANSNVFSLLVDRGAHNG